MPEGSAALQLQVGDRVVYPNQGVCRVAAIDVKEVAGQSLTFVTMRREEDGAVVMVPQGKILSIGVRKVASPADVEEIYSFLRSDSDKADLDWKQRARTNLDRMTQGGILGLAEVVKGLQVLSELRPLPTKERELYDNARHLLVSEVAAALGTAEANAEDSIDIVLFPPGKERPKRTAAEFARPGGEEDDMDLDGDLMGLEGGELDLPSDEEPQSESEEESSEEEGGEEEGGEEGGEDAPKKRGRPPKAKPAEGEEAAAPKKRGRPPKPKPEVAEGAEPAAPKKRGRPPKAKPPEGAAPAEPAAPKKRGRPPKAKPPEDE
ncbi:transcriptional regulator [Corallococcus sp. AB004]|uniref:CarD family transcriptional regulator n=1 Tax=Corallococcus TaxID=83461 RepID=UPI000EA3654E|nr:MULTISPECIES: CarD family transcriptional regulator [Corallococcus]NPC68640.1 transcriptional regulator [Corallococcus exiguus]NRD48123.1 transcriptional regulator [Corallococcus exiguus]RKH98891.1 transcriptional regulator [Corallococcus sp. AB038B]RKI47176.1 transcriptional regulator [Corallococcus sp. AB004]